MAQCIKKKLKTKKKNIIQYQEVEEDEEEHQNDFDEYSFEEQLADGQANYNYEGSSQDFIQTSSYDLNNNASLFQNVEVEEENKNGNWEVLKTEQNSKEERQITLDSDAWPEEQQVEVKSKIHRLLKQKSDKIDLNKIYFSQLESKHLKEVKNLHEEWFPLSYPDQFYERINRNNIVAIGCFIDIDKQNRKVILGTIMVKVNQGNEDVAEIYRAKDMSGSGWLGWLKQTLECREYIGAYIMTLGVVDECRRLGLGTMLLNEVIKILNKSYMTCEVIYLHVVDYNESAIRFYERNDFRTLKRIKNHYVIFEKNYDGLVLYKDINTRKDLEDSQADNEKNLNNADNNSKEEQQESVGIIGKLLNPLKYVYQEVKFYYSHQQ